MHLAHSLYRYSTTRSRDLTRMCTCLALTHSLLTIIVSLNSLIKLLAICTVDVPLHVTMALLVNAGQLWYILA